MCIRDSAECQKLGITVVSILDTNCDPLIADVPIPANDDAIRSIKLIVGRLADAIYEGRHGQPDNQNDYDELEEGIDTQDYPAAEEEAPAPEAEPVAIAAPEPVAEAAGAGAGAGAPAPAETETESAE